jgi:phosphonate degradation associated HDIG domain protein
MSPQQIVSHVIDLYNERGHRSYGEDVTELEHALQAATFSRQFGEPDEIVAACLLHDYGHLLHDLGEDIADRGVDARHEDLGADALSQWFVPDVVEPGRLHVAAKRYLCSRDLQYLAGLSPASLQSLELQGGPMSDDEARRFETQPHHRAAVQVRRYDDMGKVPGMATPSFEAFRPLLEVFVMREA